MCFKSYLEKARSGAYKSSFFSLLFVVALLYGIFGREHEALAVTTIDQTLYAGQKAPSDLAGVYDWFQALRPFNYSPDSRSDMDSFIVSISPDPNYSYMLWLFNAVPENEVFITPDKVIFGIMSNSMNRGVRYLCHNGGDCDVMDSGWTSSYLTRTIPSGESTRAYVISSSTYFYSSEDFFYTETNDLYSNTTTNRYTCGTDNCGLVIPPDSNPDIIYASVTCSASFANIPDWTDPLGMFTGFFTGLYNWFGCAFDSTIDSIANVIHTAVEYWIVGYTDIKDNGLLPALTAFKTDFIDSFGVWLGINQSSFDFNSILSTAVNNHIDNIKEKIPDVFFIFDIIQSIYDVSTVPQQVPLYEGDLHINNKTIHVKYDPFHQIDIPEIIPDTVSIFVMIGLLFWSLHKMPTILHI